MRDVTLHLTAIGTAAAVRFLIGALWYSPALFVRPWMDCAGITPAQARARMPKGIALDILASVLMAFAMAFLVGYSGAQGVEGGLSIAFLAWLGLVAPAAWAPIQYEGKPWSLWLLNTGCLLVSLLAMGAILAAWPV